MFERLLKVWGKGCLWQIGLQFVLTIAVFGCVGLMAVGVAAVPLPARYDDFRPFLFVIGLVLVLGIFFLGAIGFGAWMVIDRTRRLDAAFTPLGLRGSSYLIWFRQYHGVYKGRQMDVYLHRGPVLEIFVGTSLKTRLGMGTKNMLASAFAGLTNRATLTELGPEFEPYSAYPLDAVWARTLLNDFSVRSILLRILPPEGSTEIRTLILQPTAWARSSRYLSLDQISPETTRRWVDDLVALATAAEAVPPPTQTAEASQMEQNTRSNRGAFVLPALLIVFGVLGASVVCAVVPIVFILMADAGR